ncbi:putative oxidoreductase [Planctomycetes bacterium Poly30]|uniref:Putative oxidoreductase n=1 Tax=Saltatorellus ferox TaxID=2528018 RepID=A0A518EVC2_9BACT|nr:putative oxidoreductase [Planctomycetes bacterium Poly30]
MNGSQDPTTAQNQASAPAGVSAGSSAGAAAKGKRALIVGASSGMGEAMVQQLVAEGYAVAAVARRQDRLDALAAAAQGHPGRVVAIAHDVNRVDEVPGLVERVISELGGLDFYVYAAGVMPDVEAEEYDTEKDLLMVDVNLSGFIAWTNPIARYFHSQRSGTIVGIGSIAGDRGRKGAPVYGATKAAMETLLESLRNRLAERSVRVVTVKPGMIETPMTEHLDKLMMPVSAKRAAKEILKVSRGKLWNTRHIPLRWLPVSLVIRSIPSFLFRKTSI